MQGISKIINYLAHVCQTWPRAIVLVLNDNYSVDKVLREGFPRRVVKKIYRRCRHFLYPRGTFPKLHVPSVHIFENICTEGVHLRFALHIVEGVHNRALNVSEAVKCLCCCLDTRNMNLQCHRGFRDVAEGFNLRMSQRASPRYHKHE